MKKNAPPKLALNKVTPLLVVEAIEPSLPLYESLGYARTIEVPHEGRLGFVILQHPSVKGGELMMQTRASLQDDAASVAARAKGSLLYCDVQSLDEARKTVKAAGGCEILIEERSTPYGAKETWFVDPAGHVVGLAEHG